MLRRMIYGTEKSFRDRSYYHNHEKNCVVTDDFRTAYQKLKQGVNVWMK